MNEHRPDRTALRVLCVDDDQLTLEATIFSLTKDLDFDVLSFESPLEALTYLRQEDNVDVIVSDVMMPQLSGPDLLLASSAHSPELARRFVFLSGDVVNARKLLNVALRQASLSESPLLLQKPVSKEALLAAVAATIARGPGQSGTFAVRKHPLDSVVTDRGV